MDKKGVSQIVTTVLIILLALAAIVIVWQAVKGTIVTTTERIGAECITLDLKITDAYNGVLNVERGVGVADLDKIKVIVDGTESASSPFDVTLSELGTATLTVFEISAVDQEVKIAGVLTDGTLCGVADTVKTTAPPS